VASAPFTYNHATGGGAYDDRTIGKNLDVVESLEGGDFACFELVSFLVQIRVDAGAFSGPQTIDLDFAWTADTTGQSGGALDQLQSAAINYGVIDQGVGDGASGTDGGISDDLGSTASVVATDYTQATFTKGAEHRATIRVTDLEPGENVVLRFGSTSTAMGNRRPATFKPDWLGHESSHRRAKSGPSVPVTRPFPSSTSTS
jgi:hypothetical protein